MTADPIGPARRASVASWPLRAHRGVDGSLTAYATVDSDDPVFAGHFPAAPVVPGVFLVEFADRSAQHAFLTDGLDGAARPVLTNIKSALFQGPVLPGDTIRAEVSCKGPQDVMVKVFATKGGNDAEALAATVRLIYRPAQ